MNIYRGIDRYKFPNWEGWKIIDDYAKISHNETTTKQLCDNNIQLQTLVKSHYKEEV